MKFKPGDTAFYLGKKQVTIKDVKGHACILDDGSFVSEFDLAKEYGGIYGHEFEDQHCKIIYHMIRRGYATHTYIARLVKGDWPSDEDLISICDSGQRGRYNLTFGGRVTKHGVDAIVDVYVD